MPSGPLLQGRSIVISGVGPGLGRKLALRCADEGARLTLGARSADFLESVAKEVRDSGGKAIAVPTDVSKAEDCRNLIDAAVRAYGGINGLVNSAYKFETGAFETADLDSWRAAMDVSCFGALQLAQYALPHLRERRGAIVNVGTISTRVSTPGGGGYTIPKAALDMATRQIAFEVGPSGVRVNGALMGWMDGEPLRKGFAGRADARGISVEQLEADLAKAIPLGRLPTDEECAGAVLFLLSDLSSAMTGALIHVNGGQYMVP